MILCIFIYIFFISFKCLNKYNLVFKEYNPDEKLRQLTQNLNDIVGLVKPYDPSGQKVN